MSLFQKTNTEHPSNNQDIKTTGLRAYISYNKKIMMFKDHLNSSVLKEEYTSSISSIISYLRETLTNFKIDNKDCFPTNTNPLELDLTKMFAECPNIIINLLRKQQLPDIIYVIDAMHSPHIHTKGERVDQAEFLECLPGLNYQLAKSDFIDRIVEGLTVFEAQALLKQMNLLPSKNNLDQAINNYKERVSLHQALVRDIIDTLISSKDYYDIERARIFLSKLDLKYTLPTQAPTTQQKKLEFKKK